MGFALPDILTEDALLAQARRHDQTAIMQIYNLYFPALYQFVRLRAGDRQAAEDIVSDVFVRLIDTVGRPNGPQRSLRGWLFRVARSELHRHAGKQRRMPTAPLEEWVRLEDEDMEIQFLRNMAAERAQNALRMLSEDQQDVLLLRFGQGLSLQETADIMGKNTGAIKSLQFRAVNTLRQILGGQRIEDYP